jgi:acetyl-CoA acetyltransferase
MAIVVSGVGMHAFGRFPGLSAVDMAVVAVREALRDAGLTWRQVDAVFCGHMYAGTGAGQRVVNLLGRTGLPVINVENACSSGGAALQLAALSLEAGRYERVLAIGLEKMPRGMMDMDYFERWRRASGHAVNPAQFAMAVARHRFEHGSTDEQLAHIASKNHAHSLHNDKAMYRRAISAEEVLASPLVTDPLRLLMLCAPNEGAAAAVLERRNPRNGEVKLLGAGLRTATVWQSVGEHMPTSVPVGSGPVATVTEEAGRDAYAAAGVGPTDIDVAEVQDTDAGSELLATEDLGFCERGAGGEHAMSGASSLGGRLPVNPSGGLLSKGEPVGASALGQVYEISNQLRGRCRQRQVEGASLGLTHSLGAGGNCSVLILGADR